AGIDLRQRIVTQPQAVHDAGTVILDEDVGARRKAPHDVGAGRLLKVDDEAFLVAVDAEEIVAFAGDKRWELAGLVTAARRLDLQHLGAEVAEALGRERAGEDPGQIDDPDPLERPWPS